MATCGYIENMISVGIREMKNRFSEFVRLARNGETVLVTDRGKVVARLVRARGDFDDVDAGLTRIEADGLVERRGRDNCSEVYEGLTPVLPHEDVLDLLESVRGDR